MAELSDILFLDPALTSEDRELAKRIMNENTEKIKEESKQQGMFADIEEKDLVKRLDLAIKAVLQHRLNQRR